MLQVKEVGRTVSRSPELDVEVDDATAGVVVSAAAGVVETANKKNRPGQRAILTARRCSFLRKGPIPVPQTRVRLPRCNLPAWALNASAGPFSDR